jgi:hypothetical protein
MIYLFTTIGCPPGGSGRWTCTGIGHSYIQREKQNTKTIPKRRIHKIKKKHEEDIIRHRVFFMLSEPCTFE